MSNSNTRSNEPDEIMTLPSTTSSSSVRNTQVTEQALEPHGQNDLEAHQIQTDSTSDPSSFPGRPPGLHPLAIPPLSIKQKLYIILPQMIGAAILDGAANFGIGCAMYLNAKNVRIWILKNNTVAGDMAVTIFIQGILTFCIASGMVHVDLRKNKISAFEYPWPDTAWGAAKRKSPEQATNKLKKIWYKFHNGQGFSRGLHFFSGSDVNDIFNSKLSRSQFYTRLCWSIWKGSVLSAIFFFILWPISIAIVSPIWAGENLGNRNFTAPIIKAVYGFVYGLLMNPICAMIAMGSEDSVRHHREEKQREKFEHPEKTAMKTTAAERVSVIINNPPIQSKQTQNYGQLGVTQFNNNNNNSSTVPQRVQSLRRSLNTMDLNDPIDVNLDDEISQQQQQQQQQQAGGLEWRSADVHRRRSLDARRTSQGRYGVRPDSTSSDLTRSASVGSNRLSTFNHSPSPSGLFVPSSSSNNNNNNLNIPSSPSNINNNNNNNNRLSFHLASPNRLQTLSEDSPPLPTPV